MPRSGSVMTPAARLASHRSARRPDESDSRAERQGGVKPEVAAALKALQAEGYSFRLLPGSVEIEVGRLRVTHPGESGKGPVHGHGTRIELDGHSISHLTQSFTLEVPCDDAIAFKITIAGVA